MEHVLKVLLQFCEDYFGKYAPSKKDIHAIISRLEREGEVKTPHEILDHWRWDDLTSEFAQHIMSAQEGGSELKTWDLILGALKAARVEGKVLVEARYLLDLGGGGETPDPVGSDGGSGAVSCRGREETEPPMTAGKIAPAEPTALSSKENNKRVDVPCLVPLPRIRTPQAERCILYQNYVSVT